MADTTVGWRFTNPRMNKEWTISLGMTAEKVALEYGITCEAQDAFSAESQRRAAAAMLNSRPRTRKVNRSIPMATNTPT